MKQLEKVLTQTTWADASSAINTNNDALYVAVTTVENAAFRQKGYFTSVESLMSAYPTAEEGSQAFVYNASNSPSSPYDIYSYFNGAWIDTGLDGGSTTVDLSEKQDTLTKYKEDASTASISFNTTQNNVKVNEDKVSVTEGMVEIRHEEYSDNTTTSAIARVTKDGFNARTSSGAYITISPSGQVNFSSNKVATPDPNKTHSPHYSSVLVISSQAWMMHYQHGTVEYQGKQRQKGIGIIVTDDAISFYSEFGNYSAPMQIRKGKSDGEKGTIWVEGVDSDLKTFMLDLKARVAALEKALNITNEVQE